MTILRAPADRLGERTLVQHRNDGHFAVRGGSWKAIFSSGSGGFSELQGHAVTPGNGEEQLYDLVANLARELRRIQRR
ncbi:hypothetical protein [Nonomuraea sp. NPDC049158]|uniref:hypothetical protein n=1 Tax=Nonomuraea sp. NPDC049158 TaxID=3155649 RepID=UPI00340D9D13